MDHTSPDPAIQAAVTRVRTEGYEAVRIGDDGQEYEARWEDVLALAVEAARPHIEAQIRRAGTPFNYEQIRDHATRQEQRIAELEALLDSVLVSAGALLTVYHMNEHGGKAMDNKFSCPVQGCASFARQFADARQALAEEA